VIAHREADGFVAERFEPAIGLAVIAALSERELPTAEARRALPATVPHADAAANAARAALFALGVVAGRRELVRAGAEDFLHERYRAALVPDAGATRAALLAAGAAAAVLSGAGPTVLGIFTGSDDADALERARSAAGSLKLPPGRRALVMSGDRHGASVHAAR
jgi:homoserine kinase